MIYKIPKRYRSLNVSTEKLLIIFLYYLAFGLIWFGYYFFIVPLYGYNGYTYNPNFSKIIESVVMLTISLIILPIKFNKPSDIFLHIQFLFPIMGMLVLYGAENRSRIFIYLTMSSFFIMIFIAQNIKLKSISITKIKPDSFLMILLFIGVIYILAIIVQGGLKYLNFNLLNVYEFRVAAATSLPGIFGYLSPAVSKVIFPFAFLLAVIRKKSILALLSFVGSVLMFALTNNKGPLFYPIAVLALYSILSHRRQIRFLLLAYITIITVPLLLFFVDNSNMNILLNSLFLRRTYIVPAQLNYYYYDFFSVHQFTMWANSKVTFGLVHYPYHLGIPHLIGLNFFSNPSTGANTGWIGSGYAQFGFAGMVIYAFIVGILLGLLNAFSKVSDKRIIAAIIAVPMLTVFISSDLLTAFLTHGVILSLVLFMMFAIPEAERKDRKHMFYRKETYI